MIERKKKFCKNCLTEQFIWSKGMCKKCASLSVKKKPIAKMSVKRKVENVEYLKLRLEYLNEHQKCEIKLACCTIWAIDIHHLYSGKDRQSHFTDFDNVKAVCRSCHNWIHEHSKDARGMGWLK
jgi:hypothetical protein